MSIFCSRQCEILTCSACQELQGLQGEVEAAEVALHNAKRRRAAHLEKMNGRRAAVTRLPTEIVRYIINLFMGLPEHEMEPPEYASYVAYDRPRSFRAVHRSVPLLLAAISRQWRTVAWSLPELWSTIIITMSCPWHEHGPQLVSQWLGRSGNLPLSIQINDPNPSTTSAPYDKHEKGRINENARAIIQVLNRYASRWVTLDFSETHLALLEHLDASDCGGQSILRHLCLGGLSSNSDHFLGSPQPTILFRSSRSYRPTHLNLLFYIPPNDINIEWSALTHLHLEDMSRARLFELLSHSATHLTHLSLKAINGYNYGDVRWEPDDALTITNLVSLSISEYRAEENNTRILFEFLTVSSLRTLKYDGADSGFQFQCAEFLDLVERSLCQFESLDLERHGLLNDDLEVLLRSVPTLISLKIRLERHHSSGVFLNWLAEGRLEADEFPFLPALLRLDIAAYMHSGDWLDFINIYSNHAEHDDGGNPLNNPIPVTRDFQVKFRVRCLARDGYHGFIGHDSLMYGDVVQKLVWLWKTFGVTCVFKFESDDLTDRYDPGCFLRRSFESGKSWGNPSVISEAETKYLALWDDVVAIANLQLW